jgi:hypothetical protein
VVKLREAKPGEPKASRGESSRSETSGAAGDKFLFRAVRSYGTMTVS